MEFKEKNEFGQEVKYLSLVEYVVRRLDGKDNDCGSVQEAQNTATNNSKALGRLLECLEEQGIIRRKQTIQIVTGDDE